MMKYKAEIGKNMMLKMININLIIKQLLSANYQYRVTMFPTSDIGLRISDIGANVGNLDVGNAVVENLDGGSIYEALSQPS